MTYLTILDPNYALCCVFVDFHIIPIFNFYKRQRARIIDYRVINGLDCDVVDVIYPIIKNNLVRD